jgi:hypothetical protein
LASEDWRLTISGASNPLGTSRPIELTIVVESWAGFLVHVTVGQAVELAGQRR